MAAILRRYDDYYKIEYFLLKMYCLHANVCIKLSDIDISNTMLFHWGNFQVNFIKSSIFISLLSGKFYN